MLTLDLPHRYCLVGIAIMFAGVFWWAGWQLVLPKVFGYELVPHKETLDDGTVITSVSRGYNMFVMRSIAH